MGEEHPTPKEYVWLLTYQAFESLKNCLVDAPCPKLVDQLVVVDSQLLSICRNRALDVPGCYDLPMRRGVRWFNRRRR